MLPAGYLLKRVAPPPGWLDVQLNHVTDVCSVADCVNENVVDVQAAWQHNGFGLANDPVALAVLAAEAGQDTDSSVLFYYTAYENELSSDGWTFDASDWRPRDRAPSSPVIDAVEHLGDDSTTLLGYDVVVFNDYLEHSPLSCNSVAKDLPVNQYCLLPTLQDAVAAIESGAFGGGCEEGRYTVFAVHRVAAHHGS